MICTNVHQSSDAKHKLVNMIFDTTANFIISFTAEGWRCRRLRKVVGRIMMC